VRVRIGDVARQAQVSAITASRALSKPGLVTVKTRERVLRAAQELGYVPNRLARGLRSGKTHTVAVLTTDTQQRLNTLKLDRLHRELMQRGYQTLLLVQAERDRSGIRSQIASCRGMIDGLVLCCLEGGPSPVDVADLNAADIAVVSLEHRPELDMDTVTADRAHGAYLATSHLLRLGHTEIALGQVALASEVVERRANGYRRAMEEAGLMPFILAQPAGGVSSFEDGYLLMQAARAAGIRPSAWVFSDDELAVGAMRALNEWGQRVPEDVAIIGWDDAPLCQYIRPQLSSITQPVQETVNSLVQRLLQRMDGLTEPAELMLVAPELIVRESCGSARG
jgi:DNA-binding LacI/PurR family transcriptional regulator